MNNFIKTNKQNIFNSIAIIFLAVALFIAALTFNFIGNGIYDANLISSFLISIIVVIGLTTILVVKRKKNILNIYLWIILFIFIFASIFGISFGTFGYLDNI